MNMKLEVKTPEWSRAYTFEVRMKGRDRLFARVLSPAKAEGQGFLKLEFRLWNYLPTAERTILIPPSLMLDKFLGSDLSNDDVVKASYFPRDYQAKLVGETQIDGVPVVELELLPNPDAPVTYGKLLLWAKKSDSSPVKAQMFDEKMVLLRTVQYSAEKTFTGHTLPTVWSVTNEREPGRETTLTILDASFGEDFPDSLFTRENLEKYP